MCGKSGTNRVGNNYIPDNYILKALFAFLLNFPSFRCKNKSYSLLLSTGGTDLAVHCFDGLY